MEPVEITTPEALQERIAAGGVITITRGTLVVPIAHTADCRALRRIRVPTSHTRSWWTPDYGSPFSNTAGSNSRW